MSKMQGTENKLFQRCESNKIENKEKPNQLNSQHLDQLKFVQPNQLTTTLYPSQLNQQHQFYNDTYTNAYEPAKSVSFTYVIIFLFVILMVCAVLTGIYLTNKVDDTSDAARTSKELGKIPNKLLNMGKNLIDDISTKFNDSSVQVNPSRIIQNNKINFDEVSNFASNLLKKINDTINEKAI